jgi:hypothetical protein
MDHTLSIYGGPIGLVFFLWHSKYFITCHPQKLTLRLGNKTRLGSHFKRSRVSIDCFYNTEIFISCRYMTLVVGNLQLK